MSTINTTTSREIKTPFYITTTLPYANGMPHIGHTVEFIRADIFARYKRLMGHKVFLNTGTDEHGQKILEKAKSEGIDVQEYVDKTADKWKEFCKLLEMDYDFFSRTTAEHHKAAAQKFWKLCAEKGFIYKSQYKAKYCVGCEMEKTDSELDDNGECPDHIGKPLEQIDEENYFFKYSAFEKGLLDLYAKEPSFIIPDFRRTEIKNFVDSGLRDFSISRLKSKMSWGVSVPGDDGHVMYVWFDALPNYISCLGWGTDNNSKFKEFWEGGTTVQFCGKDNLRPQTALWQAMLLAADIKNSDHVFVGGHIISGGVKMSKSIGNTVDPFQYIEKYGIEAVRYFLARHIHGTQDSDFTAERFNELYTADLVNGLGNLVARVMKMSETHITEGVVLTEGVVPLTAVRGGTPEATKLDDQFIQALDAFDFNKATDLIWKWIGKVDEQITSEEPFKVVKIDKDKAVEMIINYVKQLNKIAYHLKPIMPKTAEIIMQAINQNKKPENLFGRVEMK